jgi:hypothetical protein
MEGEDPVRDGSPGYGNKNYLHDNPLVVRVSDASAKSSPSLVAPRLSITPLLDEAVPSAFPHFPLIFIPSFSLSSPLYFRSPFLCTQSIISPA